LRNKFKLLSFLIIFVISLSVRNYNTDLVEGNNQLSETDSSTWKSELVDHDPIFINHDDNFTDLGFQGEGTNENPFLIQNLKITDAPNVFFTSYSTLY